MRKESIIKRDPETGELVIPDHLMDCWDAIEEMYCNVPDKRKKEYKKWMLEINSIIDKANKISGFKAYNRVK